MKRLMQVAHQVADPHECFAPLLLWCGRGQHVNLLLDCGQGITVLGDGCLFDSLHPGETIPIMPGSCLGSSPFNVVRPDTGIRERSVEKLDHAGPHVEAKLAERLFTNCFVVYVPPGAGDARYQHNEGQGPAENRESVGASVRYGHTMAQARVLRRCAEALAYCPTILLATERALWLPPAQTTLPPEIA